MSLGLGGGGRVAHDGDGRRAGVLHATERDGRSVMWATSSESMHRDPAHVRCSELQWESRGGPRARWTGALGPFRATDRRGKHPHRGASSCPEPRASKRAAPPAPSEVVQGNERGRVDRCSAGGPGNHRYRVEVPRTMSIELVPMEEDDFRGYLERLIPQYASDHVRDGQWSEAESIERSRGEVNRLLPQGLRTPDQYILAIRALPEDARVGMIWLAIEHAPGGTKGFIYDLIVDPVHRRHGYGKQAMLAIEPVALAKGARTLGLHVFGYNEGAIRLYREIGYATTNLRMVKELDPGHSSSRRAE